MAGYGKSAGRELFKFWCRVKTENIFVTGGLEVKDDNCNLAKYTAYRQRSDILFQCNDATSDGKHGVS